MSEIENKFGRTLVVVAHPDDEAIGCGLLLQRLQDATVAFLTDGAPADRYFWGKFGSRSAYAEVRAKETRKALEHLKGVRVVRFGARDQELMFRLDIALEWLRKIIREQKPETIVTHCYEGGHPDHDCCSFLCSIVAREAGIPVWEIPLYSRVDGKFVRQYLPRRERAVCLSASQKEERAKAGMVQAYASQEEFLQSFEMTTEYFLPQPPYDYSLPPHDGRLNYEWWGWEVTGGDLCTMFQRVLNNNQVYRAKSA
jgi:LmbE family N-acetylglucosaminyl deacetylase